MLNDYIVNCFIDLLGQSIGTAHHFDVNPEIIEKRILKSEFYRDFINGSHSFAFASQERLIIETTGHNPSIEYFDNISLWCGYAYTHLILNQRKGLDYLFLYIPLNEMMNLYPLYHEMGWSQLDDYLQKKVKEKSLLNKLIKKNNLTKEKLALITGINVNTIKKYCFSDASLHNAPIKNIYKFAYVFDVDISMFVDRLILRFSIEYPTEELSKKIGVYLVDLINSVYGQHDYQYYDELNYIERNGIYYYFDKQDYEKSTQLVKKLIVMTDYQNIYTPVDPNEYVVVDNIVYTSRNEKAYFVNPRFIDSVLVK